MDLPKIHSRISRSSRCHQRRHRQQSHQSNFCLMMAMIYKPDLRHVRFIEEVRQVHAHR